MQIEKCVLMPAKEVKELLYKMFQEHFVQVTVSSGVQGLVILKLNNWEGREWGVKGRWGGGGGLA